MSAGVRRALQGFDELCRNLFWSAGVFQEPVESSRGLLTSYGEY